MQRIKLICDEIIAIMKKSDQSAKFGVKAMGERFEKTASMEEVATAIQTLIDNKHVKKLGQYMIGFGTGEGLNKYSLEDFDPFALAASEQPAPIVTPVNVTIPKQTPAPSKPSLALVEQSHETITIDDALKMIDAKMKADSPPRIADADQKIKTLLRLSNIFKPSQPVVSTMLDIIAHDLDALSQSGLSA